MHPNAKGVAVIVENILPKVEELLAQVKAKGCQLRGAARRLVSRTFSPRTWAVKGVVFHNRRHRRA